MKTVEKIIQKQFIQVRKDLWLRVLKLFFPAILFSAMGFAQQSSASLTFINPTLVSGTAGAVNAVYKFQNVTDGVDARVTLSAISNGATVSNVDIPSSTTGYNPAFQPTVTIASGSSSNPKTSYIEWQIRFKKAGTDTDTTLDNVSATAIDVDGNNSIQERVQAYTPSSYSVNSPNELTISTDGTSVTALGSTTDYSGIDSSIKAVMFQMNFLNVNLITYRTGGVNKTSSTTRQFSIYFKAFFTEWTPLPVELVFFDASVNKQNKVDLSWTTASETNNAFFSIERSDGSENFIEIAVISGSGNSTQTRNYKYRDEFPLKGESYYRLIQYDHDGYQKIYDPVKIKIKSVTTDLSIQGIYPNPILNNAQIEVSAANDDAVKISIFNSNGVPERTIIGNNEADSAIWRIGGLEDLESGVYYVQASQSGKVSKTVRMVKK
ncbi:MAG TPA: T9SS type A sorting domain-containing protein [Bacteroidia bacterium]|nr:T9SS type A sorting domain-containing protein [Bacteroidia bacterium]